MARHLISNLLGLVGAIIGGVLGFYTFGWLFEHGFYGLMIPGALLGLGCSLLAQHPSSTRGLSLRGSRSRSRPFTPSGNSGRSPRTRASRTS